jgi:hypothetical protein
MILVSKEVHRMDLIYRCMKELGISTPKEGEILWTLLANRDLYKGKELFSGSFRYMAGCIANICGGDYINYYCAEAEKIEQLYMYKRLKTAGFGLIDSPFDYRYSPTFEPMTLKEKWISMKTNLFYIRSAWYSLWHHEFTYTKIAWRRAWNNVIGIWAK